MNITIQIHTSCRAAYPGIQIVVYTIRFFGPFGVRFNHLEYNFTFLGARCAIWIKILNNFNYFLVNSLE